jgi:hypothetical protein
MQTREAGDPDPEHLLRERHTILSYSSALIMTHLRDAVQVLSYILES